MELLEKYQIKINWSAMIRKQLLNQIKDILFYLHQTSEDIDIELEDSRIQYPINALIGDSEQGEGSPEPHLSGL